VYGFRSGMAPMTGLGYDTRRKDYDYALLRKLVAEWKQVAPNYYGDYWPLTAWHSDPDAWMAWQFDRPKEGEGVVQAFHELREPDRRILDRTAQVARLSVAGTSLFCGERPSPEKVAPTAGKRKPTMSKSHMIGVDDHYKLAYPCIISDPAFRNNWLELLSEAIEHGADGVYLMPDEYYYKGHNLSRASCPLCAAEFKKMYGYDSLPKGGGFTVAKVGGTSVINRGKVDDTEKYRKWKLFEYRKIADVFQSVSAELKRRYPKAQIVMSDNKVTEDLGGRLEHNISLDIIENDPNADLSQVYGNAILDNVGSISAYARRIAAAAGPEKMLASIQWLNVQDWPVDHPIQLFGYAIPQIMLGAQAYENYRLNYMYDKGWWPNALECHKMIRLLEQWGVREARTLDVACLIESRASEDWWRPTSTVILARRPCSNRLSESRTSSMCPTIWRPWAIARSSGPGTSSGSSRS
jgi:hypothetical protein